MSDDEDRPLVTMGGGSRSPVSPAQRQLYLETLAETGSHLTAARAAHPVVEPQTASSYFTGLAKRDPDFAMAVRKALLASTSKAEALLYDHGTNGWDEPVFQGGTQVGTIKKFDHKLTMAIVRRGARLLGDDSWEDKKVVEHTGGQTVNHQISMRDLSPEMRKEVMAARQRLLAAGVNDETKE